MLHDRETTRPIHGHVEILEDADRSFTIQDVALRNFQPAPQNVPNFGLTESVYWIRFRFVDSSTQHPWLVNLDFPLLDEIHFYRAHDSTIERIVVTGRRFAFATRPVPHRTFVFLLPYPVDPDDVFYLRVETEDTMILPLVLTTASDFQRTKDVERLTLGAYYGIMAAMFLYNLFLFLSLRDRSYFYYVAFVGTMAIFTMYQNGLAYEWMPVVRLDPFLSSLSAVFAIQFARNFLVTARHTPTLDRILKILAGGAIVSIVLSLAPYRIAIWGGIVIAIFALPTFITAAVLTVRQGFTPGRFFLIAWLALLFGAATNAFMSIGWMENNWFTFYGVQLGSAAETVLLALGLASRIHRLRRDKEAAERELLQTRLNHQKELVEKLESMVAERTALLSRQKNDLEEALKKIHDTEMQLIQSAKMSALGQLVAGIAHEINNPITFIYSNLHHLENYIDILKRLIERLDEGPAKKPLAALKREVDYDDLVDDLNRVMRSYRSGAQRIKDIVSDLREFSHSEDSVLNDLNVNAELDMLAKLFLPQYTDDIRVHREFNDVPTCRCRTGQISQVFLNLLINAADAVQTFNRTTGRTHGNVWIRTESVMQSPPVIRVTIKDDGGGIDASVRDKIFNPFFTTKPVGRGTGLGLPISYRLVENHHGRLYFKTVENEGSEFIVELPTAPHEA